MTNATMMGVRLRELRLRFTNLNQTKLAARIGVSSNQLSNYERGITQIPAYRLRALAQAIGHGCLVDDLYAPIGAPLRAEAMTNGGLRPEALRWLGVSEAWMMGETEDYNG